MIHIISSIDASDHYVAYGFLKTMRESCERLQEPVQESRFRVDKIPKQDWIIVHSIIWAFYYVMLGYKKLIVWMPGVTAEESFMRHKSKVRFSLLSFIEYVVLKRARFVIYVSDCLREFCQKKYKLKSDNFYIMPCFNESTLHSEVFGYPDKYQSNTFTYVGSLSVWQCFEKTARLYKKIEDNLGNTKFYVFTSEKENADIILRQIGIKHYMIYFLPQEMLVERLKSIKYGFILREDNIVNNVATPTKLSTYISNGIIPIYSDSLNDFSKNFSEYIFLIKLAGKNTVDEWAQQILDFNKKEIKIKEILGEYSSIYESYYSESNHAVKISKILADLMQQC